MRLITRNRFHGCGRRLSFILYWPGSHGQRASFPTRRSSDLGTSAVSDKLLDLVGLGGKSAKSSNLSETAGMPRSEERFSRNAETDLVCRLLLEKKKKKTTRSTYLRCSHAAGTSLSNSAPPHQ